MPGCVCDGTSTPPNYHHRPAAATTMTLHKKNIRCTIRSTFPVISTHPHPFQKAKKQPGDEEEKKEQVMMNKIIIIRMEQNRLHNAPPPSPTAYYTTTITTVVVVVVVVKHSSTWHRRWHRHRDMFVICQVGNVKVVVTCILHSVRQLQRPPP